MAGMLMLKLCYGVKIDVGYVIHLCSKKKGVEWYEVDLNVEEVEKQLMAIFRTSEKYKN